MSLYFFCCLGGDHTHLALRSEITSDHHSRITWEPEIKLVLSHMQCKYLNSWIISPSLETLFFSDAFVFWINSLFPFLFISLYFLDTHYPYVEFLHYHYDPSPLFSREFFLYQVYSISKIFYSNQTTEFFTTEHYFLHCEVSCLDDYSQQTI